MVAQVLPFFHRSEPRARDWTQQELAEFYRVESALVQAGTQLETERGLSDEGEPWFVFCRADTGDVFIHFARIDGVYVVDGAAFKAPARGADFAALVRALIERYPLAQIRERSRGNVFVHPAALLIALVGAAFFHSNDAKAAEPTDGRTEEGRRSLIVTSQSLPPGAIPPGTGQTFDSSSQAAAVIMSAILTLKGDLFAVAKQEPFDHVAAVWSDLIDARAWAFPAPADAAVLVPPAPSTTAHLDISPFKSLELLTSGFDQPVLGEGGARGGAPEGLMLLTTAAEVRSDVAFSPLELPAGAQTIGPERPVQLANGIAVAPVTDAGAVLTTSAQTSAVLLEMLNKGVALVQHLPDALVDLIRRGEHLDFSTPVQPSATGSGDVPAPSQVVIPDVVMPPFAPVTPESGPSQKSTAKIDAAISAFIAQVENLEFIVAGKQVVLYDEDIFGDFNGDTNLTSVTFTFDDGSSVSLVGSAQDLGQFSWAT